MSHTSPLYRLRLPGPTAVPERVRRAIAEPVVNHRGPEFRATLARAEELIKPVIGTSGPVLFFACSGTGAMEASLVNVLSPGDRVLACIHGQFGDRFSSIATALGAKVDELQFEWGATVDAAVVKEKLESADYKAVIVVHNESSTGIYADLEALGKVVRQTPALLIVDSVSGLGGMEVRQDEWGVDILVSASQKAMMCPPGVGIVSVSEKGWDVVNRENGVPRYYWDFRRAKSAIEKSETPFTSPVALMAGMLESLEMMHAEGLSKVLARHRTLSARLRKGCDELGLRTYGKSDLLSSTVVALEVPAELNGGDIVKRMYEQHKTVIAGSRNKLQGRVIRIGTMGFVTDGDIATDLLHLDATLESQGAFDLQDAMAK